MTAKEALREKIDALTEDEAVEMLARMEWEASEFEFLSPEEAANLEAARAEVAAGKVVPAEDVFRRLGM